MLFMNFISVCVSPIPKLLRTDCLCEVLTGRGPNVIAWNTCGVSKKELESKQIHVAGQVPVVASTSGYDVCKVGWSEAEAVCRRR